MNIIYENEETLEFKLVEKEKKEFHVVTTAPEGDKIRYCNCRVNINSKDIDKDEVCMFAGMDELFDVEEFACACVEYYGTRFWGGFSKLLTKEEAKEKLSIFLDGDDDEEEQK